MSENEINFKSANSIEKNIVNSDKGLIDEIHKWEETKTLISKWLQNNPLCGFEIAGDNAPYKGVRGRGVVSVTSAINNPVLPSLVDKYLGNRNSSLAFSLLSREETELTLNIKPTWMTSWDYSRRMVKPS